MLRCANTMPVAAPSIAIGLQHFTQDLDSSPSQAASAYLNCIENGKFRDRQTSDMVG